MTQPKTFTALDLEMPSTEEVTAKGRKKFTTMLRPDIRVKLSNVAKNNQISIADALETIVIEYFELDSELIDSANLSSSKNP